LTEQLEYEPKVHLFKPHTISGEKAIVMRPWPSPVFTDDRDILLHSDSLLTVVEPNPETIEKYLKKIGLTLEDLKPKEEPKVLLNEEEEAVPESDDWIDDYEPSYSQI
tara:strand:+ start:338 stop:661 length:324 start_codon:yes stop_codon:yes gene_type:complete